MVSSRPSHGELSSKLLKAKDVLRTRSGLFADPAKAVGELNALDIGDSAEVWPLILGLLDEIGPADYAGARPPMKSYEAKLIGVDLFAFSWDSAKLAKQMYLKFAVKNDCFYYVSLHQDRPPTRGKGEKV